LFKNSLIFFYNPLHWKQEASTMLNSTVSLYVFRTKKASDSGDWSKGIHIADVSTVEPLIAAMRGNPNGYRYWGYYIDDSTLLGYQEAFRAVGGRIQTPYSEQIGF
jgi:hypothetical protein